MKRQFLSAQRVLDEGQKWCTDQLLLEGRRGDWTGAQAWKNALWDRVAPLLVHAYLRRREREDHPFRDALCSVILRLRPVKALYHLLHPADEYGELLNQVIRQYNWEQRYPQDYRYLIEDSYLKTWDRTHLGLYRAIAVPGLNVSSAAWLAQAIMTPEVWGLVFFVGTNDCQRYPPPRLIPQLYPLPAEPQQDPETAAEWDDG